MLSCAGIPSRQSRSPANKPWNGRKEARRRGRERGRAAGLEAVRPGERGDGVVIETAEKRQSGGSGSCRRRAERPEGRAEGPRGSRGG